jgi:hypothetical protein
MNSNNFKYKSLLVFLGCGTLAISGLSLLGIIFSPSYEALQPMVEDAKTGVEISQH